MSAKRWADEYSSDEGSIDPESDDEPVPSKPVAVAAKATSASTKTTPSAQTVAAPAARVDQYIVYISNINAGASRMEVGQFFEQRSCSINNLDVNQGQQGRNSSATMEFKDANSLSIALSLNGENFQGIPIRTKIFEVRGHGGPAGHRQTQQQGGRGGFRDNRDAPRGPNRNEEDRFPGRRHDGGRDGGRGRGGGTSRERPSREVVSAAAAPVPATRPKLNLAPRTLPVDLIGKAVSEETKPDIFGGGRPHDEILYEEKKKSVDPKDETDGPVPDTVFELQALKEALPDSAEGAAPEASQRVEQLAQQGAQSTHGDVRSNKGGRGTGPQGGRGGGRESGDRWTKEAPKAGRGGAGGRGPGRTVEVTGSYVIEKPAGEDDESSSKGGGKGPKPANRKSPREDGTGKGFGAGKPNSTKSAREPRQPTRVEGAASGDTADSASAAVVAGPGGAKDGRPKGAAGTKLFNTAMQQASGAKGKKGEAAAGPTDAEKFLKAQEKLAGKGDYRTGAASTAAGGAVKKANSFAALNESDSEDE